ncbi:glycoside hydrolase family 3 protein [Colwellia sp. Arc7-635]|uniref:glycoside hydrolase family 3 protein n=1 Tax=Colwellia sp. Arc7-635 TaxID=2497879 RepID=UPI000F850FB5|nr:exo 1,3/1,4-beta-D-glucan glucohydrolase [Colwellia sp. Arc7-635]AZQ84850.1 glycoside hydrolase family 3 protein [Colwellia sp. Arc7-635]
MNKFSLLSLLLLSTVSSLGLIACNSTTEISSVGNEVDLLSKQLAVEKIARTNEEQAIWPKIVSEVKTDPALEQEVQRLLSQMTLAQKVAQMIQPEIRDITPEDMRKYGFGSYLNGGGAFPNNNKHATPQDWIALAEAMYQASVDDSLDGSSIPTMWGTDAVHGHNNVIGATLFPHNIGLGAANNPQLVEQIAKITATEVMVTGIDWVFAPTVATVRDDRWGRTYEGYSEDPEIVKSYAASVVKGLQGHAGNDFLGDDRVISTVKHFIGDGGTIAGDDQGDNVTSEQELYDLHAQGYVGGLTAGAQSVMASFNSWHGDKIHGNRYLLTDVLKEKMGFDGFVVGDWNGHGQIVGCSNDNCPQAINAGLDIFMVPTDAWKALLENTIAQVKQGIILPSRIDDAVSRILRVKLRAGLFDKPSPASRLFSGKTELVGSEAHREVARQAVRESLVLLKNKANILPLSPKLNILVAGDAANNIGKQSGGWSITWQGTNNSNDDFPGGSSIYQGLATQIKAAGGSVTLSEEGLFLQKPDVAIVVFGEEPYAEGHGDKDNLAYQRGMQTDLALLKKLKAQGIPVVSIFITGRPLWVNAELNASDAFVAAWLPGSEGKAVADVLLRDENNKIQHDFKGKLSFSWPKTATQVVNRFDEVYEPLLPYGYGLSYQENTEQMLLSDHLSEQASTDDSHIKNTDIFSGKVLKPWRLFLTSEQQSFELRSNSAILPGVLYRTVDKVVQEDAFRLETNGDAKAGVIFTSSFREDLAFELEQNSAVVVTLKREGNINKPVDVEMHCESIGDALGSCRAAIDIQSQLQALPEGQWQDIGIALKCFADKGVKMNEIVSPFALYTKAAVKLSISHLRFEPQLLGEDVVFVNCP